MATTTSSVSSGINISTLTGSGIDTNSLITQLVQLEQDKVTKVQTQADSYQTRITTYDSINAGVTDIQTKLNALNDAGFSTFTTTSSNPSVVSLAAASGGTPGDYSLDIYQTAKAEKVISSDQKISSQTAALSAAGITNGTITINGVDITVNSTDTIQDLRAKINNTTKADGSALGVNASVVQVSANNFRLVLSASNTVTTSTSGTTTSTQNNTMTLKDTTGSVLQNLGLIQDANGGLGVTNQVIQSNDSIADAFSALAIGQTITFTGTDHAGNAVNGSFVKQSNNISDLQTSIYTAFHGMANVNIADSASGGQLSLTDNVGGTSAMALTSLNFGATSHTAATATVGTQGQNVLSVGQNAYFAVDGVLMNNATNTASGFIQGVTLTLAGKTNGTSAEISIARDMTSISQKITDLLTSYNTLLNYVNQETKYGDTTSGTTNGSIAGDMTARTIVQQIHDALISEVNTNAGTQITSLAMIGLTTNTTDGTLSIDSAKLTDALTNHFNDVENLFVTRGYSDVSGIAMGRSTSSSTDGVYSLSEVDANNVQVTSPDGTSQTIARSGDIVYITSGQGNGLGITYPSGTGNATFTFSNGINGLLGKILTNITDPLEGTIKMQDDSFNDTIKRLNDQVTTMQTNVDSYKTRLTNEFAAMNANLQTLKSQMSNMLSQLGTTTSSTTN